MQTPLTDRHKQTAVPPRLWAVIAYLLLPYALLNLLWKGLRYRAYFDRLGERFGFVQRPAASRLIWVHAVSVGEVHGASGLVRALQSRYPQHHVLVTTMTPTGAQQVRRLFGDTVSHCYLPYDLPGATARFLDSLRPDMAFIAETEFWPNLFHACRSRAIPLILVSVRVSAASLSGYLRVPTTARRVFTSATLVCAQTRTDAQRLRNLGVEEARLCVTGNLKFDAEVQPGSPDASAGLRQLWGPDRVVIVAGSTHAGEEQRLLAAWRDLFAEWQNVLLVIAPRNPERFSAVYRACSARGWNVVRHSMVSGTLGPAVEVMILDSMGELQAAYAAGDIAFVGGSLVKVGGHNLLEPCAVGRPVIFGPHMFHCESTAARVVETGAGRQVYDARALVDVLQHWLRDPALRAAAGAAGLRLIQENRGVVDRTLAVIERRLPALSPAQSAAGAAGPVTLASGS